MIDELLLMRYISHDCSPEEVERVEQWIIDGKANADRFFEIERIWNLKDELRFSNEKEVKTEYNRLMGRLTSREQAGKTDKAKRINQTEKRKKSSSVPHLSSFFHWAGYAAAIVILGLLSAHLYLDREEEVVAMNIIEVPSGQRVHLTLSDGTKVHLNAGSRFTYPSGFSARNRTVGLTGEGYFEVMRNEESPFIVSVSLLDVKVLGTQFNVKAYAGEDTEVTLEKGKVEVYIDPDTTESREYGNGDTSGPRKAIKQAKATARPNANGLLLSPHQQLLCTAEKQVSLKEVDPLHVKSWMTGDFFFDSRPLNGIMKELERRFDVHIRIQDPRLAEEIFTCHAKAGATLYQILDVLRNTQQLTYIQNENTIVILTSKSNMPMK